ncbi:helix-turn-helix domain-containing protein (plasmid) [Nitratidesulfovibrio vulgaris]|jgi:transcriptional regulator with XRE-family HTH domain|nr:LexA family transcriptional regulator [Nitratidesulfovibrio vulgaris]WCB48146.1 helix-turn-helix domain-containing protein [Nitratidesulfovibrio vulgaris]
MSKTPDDLTLPVLAQRMRLAREKLGWTQSALAQRVGVRAQTIQAIESGRIRKSRYLPEIAAVLGVGLAWLNGEQEQLTDRRGDTRRILYLEWAEADDPVLALAVRRSDASWMLSAPAEIISGDRRRVIGPDAFVLVVEDAALSPLLEPGDRVIIDPAGRAEPGDVVLIHDGSESMLRRYRQLTASEAEFRPMNEDYPVLVGATIRIIGVVVETRRFLGGLRRHITNLTSFR